MINKLCFLVAVIALYGSFDDATTFKVIRVIDGDTVEVLSDGKPLRLRLEGIDAPERGQPYGKSAKEYLADLVAGKKITFVDLGEDKYKRTIARIRIDGVDVCESMVKNGFAWHYVKYAKDDLELAKAEMKAREAKRGLWSDKRRVAPWKWRKLSKAERDKLR